jgi:hypothetical protein
MISLTIEQRDEIKKKIESGAVLEVEALEKEITEWLNVKYSGRTCQN